MSRRDHGLDLREPVLQPGSSRFEVTASGFDTGERTFVVDSEYYAQVVPERDTPDTKVRWRDASGVRSGTHARMYVDTVSILEERNGQTRYTVRYLGMIGRNKPDDITEDTELGQYRARVSRKIIVVGNAYMKAYESTPTVTHVYVTKTQPLGDQVGAQLFPPRSNPSSKEAIKRTRSYVSAIRDDDDILFEGWILRSRAVRQRGSMYEVRDVYSYERVRKQT